MTAEERRLFKFWSERGVLVSFEADPPAIVVGGADWAIRTLLEGHSRPGELERQTEAAVDDWLGDRALLNAGLQPLGLEDP